MRPGWVYRNNAHPDPNGAGTVTFGSRQARLDRLDNWELVDSPDMVVEVEHDRLIMPPVWADAPELYDVGAQGPGTPKPDPAGASLVVITHASPARRTRKGVPPATIADTPLSPRKAPR